MSSRIFVFIIALTTLLCFFNPISYANQGGGQGKGHGAGQGAGHGAGHGMGKSMGKAKSHGVGNKKSIHAANKTKANNNAHFSKGDKSTISNYVKDNNFPAEGLPPGIAKNVARGKPLPPGIEKRFLPGDLLSKLQTRPGFEYLAVGKDVVLVNSKTQLVEDIISNVLQ